MKWLTAKEVSERWGGLIHANTLANWRSDPDGPKGPPFSKFGARVLYREDLLIEWEQANIFSSNKEYRASRAETNGKSGSTARRNQVERIDAEFEARRQSLAVARAHEDRQLEQEYEARRTALMHGDVSQEPASKRARGRPKGSRKQAPKLFPLSDPSVAIVRRKARGRVGANESG